MNYKIIFETIVGSQAYGMATPTSDIDKKFIFCQHPDEILSDRYVDYVEINKDHCGFEVCKFINLLKVANPTALELLYSPKECIRYIHPAFEIILSERNKFLTKKCCNSFAEYGRSQLEKAFSLDKKMNWETSRITKKNPFDFCWVYIDGKTIPLEVYLFRNKMRQENVGLVALDHFTNTFALYYKENAGYRGVSIDKGSAIRTTSIPKGETALISMHWNKDGWVKFCKDYKDFETWKEKRNIHRYVDTSTNGQKIDGKNCSHCVRLLSMAEEIAKHKTLNVYRQDAEYLLDIRLGKVDLKNIIETSKNKISELKILFEKSELPDDIDPDFIHDLILRVRQSISW